MPKALVARFSQTGTTAQVAESIARGLGSAGWQVDLHDIAADGVPGLDGYELLGVGTPTYFYRPPFVTQDFVRALPDLDGLASFVFVLHGTTQGDCGNWIRKRLQRKGAADLGYFHCFGADYWLGYMQRGYLFSPDSPTDAELASAEEFGGTVAARHGKEAPGVEALDGPTPLMYGLERLLVNRLSARLMYSKTFRVDGNCDGCGICVSACPVHNITARENGKPRWHSNCLLCATCELKCPQDAIHSALDWVVFAPFMNYNIKRAVKELYPYVQIEHARGKTRRI